MRYVNSGRYVVAYGGGPPSVRIKAGAKAAWRLTMVSRATMSSRAGAMMGRVTRMNLPHGPAPLIAAIRGAAFTSAGGTWFNRQT